MKKLVAILLTLIFCLGIFVSCDNETQTESSSEKEKITVRDISTGFEAVLSDEDAQVFLDANILNEDVWKNGMYDHMCQYIVCVDGREIFYSLTAGMFEYNRQNIMLSDEEAGKIYSVLKKYFGEIYFFTVPIVKNVVSSNQAPLSYSDYCEIYDIFFETEWRQGLDDAISTPYHFCFDNLTIRYSTEGYLFNEENGTKLRLTSEERASINAILEKYPSLNKQQ